MNEPAIGAIPWYAHRRDTSWVTVAPSREVIDHHRTLAEYAPTPLVDLPALATELGVGRVLVKDESARLGLPAFKALGASWALHRALARSASTSAATVVAATDGNHGRAVARFARRLGHHALIFLPDGVHPDAAQAIWGEGAEVVAVGGSYDDAVAAAARTAGEVNGVLIQDTAWEGYTDIPGWIVDGYTTLFLEIDDELRERRLAPPDLVVVPVGVGSLLQAALTHYRSNGRAATTAVLSAEAETAACVAPSLLADRPVTVATKPTAMAGLNCGTLSTLAWPLIRAGLDAAAAVTDAEAVRAARDLAALGVTAGPCGAAALAAARLALTGPAQRRDHLRVGATGTVVLLCTEGAGANPLPDNGSHPDPGSRP